MDHPSNSSSSRKLVEVFIDTDSESESYTSSEEAVASDNAETEETVTAEEVASEREHFLEIMGPSSPVCITEGSK